MGKKCNSVNDFKNNVSYESKSQSFHDFGTILFVTKRRGYNGLGSSLPNIRPTYVVVRTF